MKSFDHASAVFHPPPSLNSPRRAASRAGSRTPAAPPAILGGSFLAQTFLSRPAHSRSVSPHPRISREHGAAISELPPIFQGTPAHPPQTRNVEVTTITNENTSIAAMMRELERLRAENEWLRRGERVVAGQPQPAQQVLGFRPQPEDSILPPLCAVPPPSPAVTPTGFSASSAGSELHLPDATTAAIQIASAPDARMPSTKPSVPLLPIEPSVPPGTGMPLAITPQSPSLATALPSPRHSPHSDAATILSPSLTPPSSPRAVATPTSAVCAAAAPVDAIRALTRNDESGGAGKEPPRMPPSGDCTGAGTPPFDPTVSAADLRAIPPAAAPTTATCLLYFPADSLNLPRPSPPPQSPRSCDPIPAHRPTAAATSPPPLTPPSPPAIPLVPAGTEVHALRSNFSLRLVAATRGALSESPQNARSLGSLRQAETPPLAALHALCRATERRHHVPCIPAPTVALSPRGPPPPRASPHVAVHPLPARKRAVSASPSVMAALTPQSLCPRSPGRSSADTGRVTTSPRLRHSVAATLCAVASPLPVSHALNDVATSLRSPPVRQDHHCHGNSSGNWRSEVSSPQPPRARTSLGGARGEQLAHSPRCAVGTAQQSASPRPSPLPFAVTQVGVAPTSPPRPLTALGVVPMTPRGGSGSSGGSKAGSSPSPAHVLLVPQGRPLPRVCRALTESPLRERPRSRFAASGTIMLVQRTAIASSRVALSQPAAVSRRRHHRKGRRIRRGGVHAQRATEVGAPGCAAPGVEETNRTCDVHQTGGSAVEASGAVAIPEATAGLSAASSGDESETSSSVETGSMTSAMSAEPSCGTGKEHTIAAVQCKAGTGDVETWMQRVADVPLAAGQRGTETTTPTAVSDDGGGDSSDAAADPPRSRGIEDNSGRGRNDGVGGTDRGNASSGGGDTDNSVSSASLPLGGLAPCTPRSPSRLRRSIVAGEDSDVAAVIAEATVMQAAVTPPPPPSTPCKAPFRRPCPRATPPVCSAPGSAMAGSPAPPTVRPPAEPSPRLARPRSRRTGACATACISPCTTMRVAPGLLGSPSVIGAVAPSPSPPPTPPSPRALPRDRSRLSGSGRTGGGVNSTVSPHVFALPLRASPSPSPSPSLSPSPCSPAAHRHRHRHATPPSSPDMASVRDGWAGLRRSGDKVGSSDLGATTNTPSSPPEQALLTTEAEPTTASAAEDGHSSVGASTSSSGAARPAPSAIACSLSLSTSSSGTSREHHAQRQPHQHQQPLAFTTWATAEGNGVATSVSSPCPRRASTMSPTGSPHLAMSPRVRNSLAETASGRLSPRDFPLAGGSPRGSPRARSPAWASSSGAISPRGSMRSTPSPSRMTLVGPGIFVPSNAREASESIRREHPSVLFESPYDSAEKFPTSDNACPHGHGADAQMRRRRSEALIRLAGHDVPWKPPPSSPLLGDPASAAFPFIGSPDPAHRLREREMIAERAAENRQRTKEFTQFTLGPAHPLQWAVTGFLRDHPPPPPLQFLARAGLRPHPPSFLTNEGAGSYSRLEHGQIWSSPMPTFAHHTCHYIPIYGSGVCEVSKETAGNDNEFGVAMQNSQREREFFRILDRRLRAACPDPGNALATANAAAAAAAAKAAEAIAAATPRRKHSRMPGSAAEKEGTASPPPAPSPPPPLLPGAPRSPPPVMLHRCSPVLKRLGLTLAERAFLIPGSGWHELAASGSNISPASQTSQRALSAPPPAIRRISPISSCTIQSMSARSPSPTTTLQRRALTSMST